MSRKNRVARCVVRTTVGGIAVLASVLVVAAPIAAGRTVPNGVACDAPELVCRAAENQDRSLYVRDRCRFEQRLLMERFEYDKQGQVQGALVAKRQTTVVIEPDVKADATRQIPIITRVVADTNDQGEPKEKVDPNARTGLASQAFLDEVFFPLLPEDLPYLTFEEVPSKIEGERWFKFTPKSNAVLAGRPVAAGVAQLDASTGEVLTMQIVGLTNLQALDSRLDKISSFSAKIDYSQFGGKYRMPTAANGSGVSDVSRFKGLFKFVFEEGKYVPVMKIDVGSQ